jgi:hypothetical protein
MQHRLKINDTRHELGEYDVAIVQTGWYDWQYKLIKRLQSVGVPVLINIDDWIKGIGRRAKGLHANNMWNDFTKRSVQEMHERILRESDGILASTPVLASKLAKYNKVGLAPNGLDLQRYSHWRDPGRDDGFIVGWAGGVGHTEVIREISEPVSSAIRDLNAMGIKSKLCVVGQDERDSFGQPDALYMKWAGKHIYPKFLSCFDVSLAPSREDSFYRYKSQLRLYEAAALGTPTLGGELYSDEIEGFGEICRTRDDWYNAIMAYGSSPEMRDQTRQFCYDNVERFTIDHRIGLWESQIQSLLGLNTNAEPQPYLKSTFPVIESKTVSSLQPIEKS